MHKYTVTNYYNGLVIAEAEAESFKVFIARLVRDKVRLRGANLGGADLNGVNLGGAILCKSNLDCASLRGANLAGADCTGASLEGADLYSANLDRAILAGANLRGTFFTVASFYGASLDENTRLPTGEIWKDYLGVVVPQLLQAGGKPLREVATVKHFSCHGWDNCPMAAAFGASGLDKVPLLHRPRVEQFVQLFDAGLITLQGLGLHELVE